VDNPESNSIDEFLDEGLKQQEIFKQLTEKSNALIHRVFVQNETGAELLAKWKDQLIMIPSVQPHYTQFEAGIAEGAKMFIRNIILQSESVEKDL